MSLSPLHSMLDISNVNDPTIDFKLLYARGLRLMYHKESEGVSFNDPIVALHTKQAKAAGIRVGKYHFARPDHNTPKEEVQHFASRVHTWGKMDLRAVLDFEVGKPSARYGKWAKEWLSLFRKETGEMAMFYTYPSYAEGLGLTTPLGDGLWLASYSRNDGKEHPYSVPKPWKSVVAHQFTSQARVPGISGYVDLSYVFKPRVLTVPKGGL